MNYLEKLLVIVITLVAATCAWAIGMVRFTLIVLLATACDVMEIWNK